MGGIFVKDVLRHHGAPGLNSWLLTLLLFACVFAGVSSSEGSGKEEPMAKISPELRALYDAYVAAQRSGTPFSVRDPLISIVDGRVIVDAVASGDVAALETDLVALGMHAAVSAGRIVSGQLPISAIGAVAALPSLRFVRAATSTTQERSGGTRH
jgi:hypothetical protein